MRQPNDDAVPGGDASAEDAVFSQTLDGIITSWNAAAEALFGYTAEEAIGQDVNVLVAPQLSVAERDKLADILRGDSVGAFRTRYRAKDGSELDLSVSVSPIWSESEEVVGVTKIARPISELKGTEEPRARLAALVDSSDDAIISMTPAGVITSWNRGAQKIFDYIAEEAIGKSITLIIPVERLGEEEQVLSRIRAGERVEHFETVRVRKDGTKVDISLTVSPIKDVAGQIVGASKIARDITERKRIETERDLLYREAHRANRAKDEFLAMLGHELRNPIGAISTAVRLLEDVRADDAIAVRARAVIARQTQHLAGLVDDLLDVGRVMAGKILLEPMTQDLADTVSTHLATLGATGQFGAHSIVSELESVWVRADPVRIEQIVGNLLNNALKYTDPGKTIRIRVCRAGDDALVEVQDEGVGIPAELIPHVFDLFVQGERRLDRSQGGLGIGLTLVRRLVELHGGSVEAISAGHDRGSTFRIRLRAVPKPEPLESKRSSTTPVPLGAKRVLIVEDNPDARDMLRDLLQTAGNEVLVANDGVAGVEIALRMLPDITLVDIGLPLLDGYEVARQIRASPEGARLMLVAITGYGSGADRARSAAAGFNMHLTKPVDGEELVRLLRTAPEG